MDLNLPQIAQIWRYGSVVRSWLLDLTRCAHQESNTEGMEALSRTPARALDGRRGHHLNVSASDYRVSDRRIRSREENNFTDRMLAIMRNEFGGHAVKKD